MSPEDEEDKLRQIHAELQGVYKEFTRRPYWHKMDENHRPVPCSIEEFGRQFDDPNRIIGRDQLGPYIVSTVFIGLDHGFGGPSLWFETMVYSVKTEKEHFFGFQPRYETYEQALAGHQLVVKLVHDGMLP